MKIYRLSKIYVKVNQARTRVIQDCDQLGSFIWQPVSQLLTWVGAHSLATNGPRRRLL